VGGRQQRVRVRAKRRDDGGGRLTGGRDGGGGGFTGGRGLGLTVRERSERAFRERDR
jgi:hypothetical protein